ncbi:Gfo/Idh/MocA family protein [Fodinibius sediminis]|uniref:Predicted dehydrogenase n=1 Tax=Fodinibius sediminis TaxID=1214077 RepID=A0A521BZQ2_9BACT|nr:Gfo/Idh/MocA family oxidoreductase [Fodinibius sediminis]SMO52682.1 Predicted dehydrogenase [Fodinibius sediminis]
MNIDNKISRKDFVKKASVTGIGLSVAPFSILKAKDEHKVRIGFIGVGLRGTSHVRGLAEHPDVEIPAICDKQEINAETARKVVTDAGLEAPELYTRGETDYLRMLERDDLDGVIIATPWLWHVPMAVAAMEAGKYVGLEVPAATTIDGCWDLVKTSERTGMPCMMLENACYSRDVLAILNMVRQGVFGEMVHARCAYNHNLLAETVLLNEQGNFGPGTGNYNDGKGGESNWRTQHHVSRNGDIYPTHGIGPVAHWMDINRGNRFHTITSTATKSRRLHDEIIERGGHDAPKAGVEFKQGDMVTSTITTANGESIIVTFSTTLPQVHDGDYRCQGTKGVWQVGNNSIYIDGVSPGQDQWESFDKYQKEYDSALWQKEAANAEGASHGGIDYFVRKAFVETVKQQTAPPIDVYDAAAWSAISPLSEESVAMGGHPVEFPDFTDGKWMTNERIFNPESA